MARLTRIQQYLTIAIVCSSLLLAIVYLQNYPLTQFSSASSQLKQASPEEEIAPPEQLMPNRNHNHHAADYAYDVTEIRAYLTGEKEYTGENLVFLTIDDGANFDTTPRVLDILAEHDVPATFFPIGRYINEENASLYQRQIRDGHAIGLHSYYHDLGLLYPAGIPDAQQINSEAIEAENRLKSIFGMKFNTRVWRYPGGHMSWQGLETADQMLKERDLEWIDWNANIGDAEPESRRPTTLEEMLDFHQRSSKNSDDSLKPIQVVLMHDTWGKELTVQALPHVIQYYKSQGYTFGVLY